MARKKKTPTLVIILVDRTNPNNIVEGTFMGMFDDNMAMVGNEDKIDMYSLSKYLIFCIEEYGTNAFTYPSAMEDDQKVAREVLQHVSSLLPVRGLTRIAV